MKRQHGLTMISWLVVLTVIGFFIMVGLRVVPVYLEHHSVKNVLESLNHEPFISRKPVSEIRNMLFRRFDINNINGLDREQVRIRRSGGITTIEINYEKRRPIAGNVEVLMTFNERLELVAN
ncbi:MAG: DUF4845 domain-containing protein [Gammaproteobacteria bacterium]|nr:DUF4845 domain-containing protein [Gammaproteobacteria bacterium]